MLDAAVDKDSAASDLQELRKIFTKSVVASVDIAAGTTLTSEHLKLKKPGTGLSASSIPDLIGRKAKQHIKADETVLMESLDF